MDVNVSKPAIGRFGCFDAYGAHPVDPPPGLVKRKYAGRDELNLESPPGL